MPRRQLDRTLDCISRIDRAASPAEVAGVLLTESLLYGFTNVFAGTIPSPGMSAQQQIANVVMHQWPQEWSERYFKEGYLFDDPTIHRVCTTTDPFLWSETTITCQHDARAARIMNEAGDFGLGIGFTVPMLTLEGQSAGLSFAGEKGELPATARGGLQLLAIYAFGRALASENTTTRARLTRREADILHWIAEGKTDWEIGMILHISEHTVDKVARHIRAKYSAPNRMAAVARALREGAIR